MSWLKKARGLKRVTAAELSEMCGLSAVAIRKIEQGERRMTEEASEAIYGALGFTSREVPFNTEKLLQIASQSLGEVCLGYVVVDDVLYFNSVEDWSDEDKIFEGDYIILDSYFAELLLKSQLALFG